MPFPATRAELKKAGYEYSTDKTCPCGETMELWTTPAGKTMPMNPMETDESEAVSHWATCVKAVQFRRQK